MSRLVLPARAQKSLVALACVALAADAAADRALDAQNRPELERIAARAIAAADASPQDAAAQIEAARTNSLLAQLGAELGDKALGRSAAETGIRAAQRAVALRADDAEARRLLGTLCGQAIPGNVMAAMKWGRCAIGELNKAVELAPKSSAVWLARGVGNHYLPPAFGGGADKAIADLEKAVQLNARSADAHLWLGIALRKAGRNAEARQAIERSVQLNPNRKWAREQLEKTPAR